MKALAMYLTTGDSSLVNELANNTQWVSECRELPPLSEEAILRLVAFLARYDDAIQYFSLLWGAYFMDCSKVSLRVLGTVRERLNRLLYSDAYSIGKLVRFLTEIAARPVPGDCVLTVIDGHLVHVASHPQSLIVFHACLKILDTPLGMSLSMWDILSKHASVYTAETFDKIMQRFSRRSAHHEWYSKTSFVRYLPPVWLCRFAQWVMENETWFMSLNDQEREYVYNAVIGNIKEDDCYFGIDTGFLRRMIEKYQSYCRLPAYRVDKAIGIVGGLTPDSLVAALEKWIPRDEARNLTRIALERWGENVVQAINKWGETTRSIQALQGACMAIEKTRFGKLLSPHVKKRAKQA